MSDVLIVGVIVFIGTCVTAYFNYKATKNTREKIAEIHVLINSRMSELLKSTQEKYTAEGNITGRKELTEENKK